MTDELPIVKRLNAILTAWNNPPSEGLPEGASVISDSAILIRELVEALEIIKDELLDESRIIERNGERGTIFSDPALIKLSDALAKAKGTRP